MKTVAELRMTDATDRAACDGVVLRDAVAAYFVAERARGVSQGRILASVQGILARAERRVGSRVNQDDLAGRLVEWCVAQSA
jgi:hypothetical protein